MLSQATQTLRARKQRIKKQIESQKGLITVGGKQQHEYLQEIDKLQQENKELKEEIQFHNKENSNLLAERNAAQIGYDEIREVRERYRSALEEIRELAKKSIKISYNLEVNSMLYDITDKIKEVLE